MNYVFGGLARELEYKSIKPNKKTLEKLEDMTDVLVDFEEPNGDIAGMDYDVKPGVCEIYVRCPELVVKSREDRKLLEAIGMADKFEFRCTSVDSREEILLTLTVNV